MIDLREMFALANQYPEDSELIKTIASELLKELDKQPTWADQNEQ